MSEIYTKEFNSWNEQSKAINDKPPIETFREREIWWCALGVNIGSEQDGKNQSFERPILIIKRFGSDLLLIAPLTTRISNDQYRVFTDSTGYSGQIIISQIRVISSKRLLRRMCRVKSIAFQETVLRFVIPLLSLLKIETPP